MVGNQVAEVAGWVAHFLSRLPPEARAGLGEATRGRVLVMLARILDVTDEEKLQLGAQLLTDQRNNQLVGVTLAGVLVGKSPAHKDLCTGIAQFLKADLSRDSPDYQPPKDDLQAMVCYQVLRELRRSIGSGEAPGKAVAGRADGSGGSGANSAAGKGGKDGKSGGKKGKGGKGGKGGGEDEDDEEGDEEGAGRGGYYDDFSDGLGPNGRPLSEAERLAELKRRQMLNIIFQNINTTFINSNISSSRLDNRRRRNRLDTWSCKRLGRFFYRRWSLFGSGSLRSFYFASFC
jgi:hypothetical protein